MNILYILLILLIVSRAFAEVAVRFKQPPLVGELCAGIVIGLIGHTYADVFPLISGIKDDPVFLAMVDLGIFFLMLYGGIELESRDLAKSSKDAVLVACGGMLLPLVSGFAFGWWIIPDSPYHFAQSLFIGTALGITAVPVAIKVLIDLKKLNSRVGHTVISAAVIDDVLSLLLLAVLTAVVRSGDIPGMYELSLIGVKCIVFFVVSCVAGCYVFPYFGHRLREIGRSEEVEFSMLLVAALAYAVFAEALGMHFILGAFIAGVFFTRRTYDSIAYSAIRHKVRALTSGFFAPIFFVSIGLHLDLSAFVDAPLLVVALIVLACFGKIVGAGLVALPLGFSRRDALAIGTAMNARGAVELIVAGIALRAGIFSHPEPTPLVVTQLFSAIVIMAVFTTLITPILLRLTFRWHAEEDD